VLYAPRKGAKIEICDHKSIVIVVIVRVIVVIIVGFAFVRVGVDDFGAVGIDNHAGIVPLKIIIAGPVTVPHIVFPRIVIGTLAIDAKGGIAIAGNPQVNAHGRRHGISIRAIVGLIKGIVTAVHFIIIVEPPAERGATIIGTNTPIRTTSHKGEGH
jgi:hypothetical protein